MNIKVKVAEFLEAEGAVGSEEIMLRWLHDLPVVLGPEELRLTAQALLLVATLVAGAQG